MSDTIGNRTVSEDRLVRIFAPLWPRAASKGHHARNRHQFSMDQRRDTRNQAACSRKKRQWQEIPGTGGDIQGTRQHVPGRRDNGRKFQELEETYKEPGSMFQEEETMAGNSRNQVLKTRGHN
jgi:hypothetical protein